MASDDEDKRSYKVVVNHEEQYSIWFADRENAPGWRDAGKTGLKAECLAFIEDVWTDVRPLSLRTKMAEQAKTADVEPVLAPAPASGIAPLVERLQEEQEIEATLPRPEPKLLKEAINRAFVLVTFTRTGTRLGIALDRGACDSTHADFDAGSGAVTLVGDLTLNYAKVRFRGRLNLGTLRGAGRLESVSGASGERNQKA